MRPLDKLLEAERAAGLCDLEATPSGKAMRDRIWARTQASIVNGDRNPDDGASGFAGRAGTWGWKSILFATLVLAIAPAVVSFTGEETREEAKRADVAPSGMDAPPAAPVTVLAPSHESTTVAPSGIDSVSVDALPPAPAPGVAPSAVRARAAARVASPSSPAATAGNAPPRELTASPPANETDRLDLERRLLDQARRALAARDYASAGATLRTYTDTFDDGQLVEEEQALEIRWLAASGQRDAAREMAARFKKRFPNSFFRPVVETALGGTSQEGKLP